MPVTTPSLPAHHVTTVLGDGVRTIEAWGIPLMRSAEGAISEDRAHVLHRDARSGTLLRLRPGVFVDPERWNAAFPRERQLATAVAIAMTSRTPPVFCRETALLFHGLPLDTVPSSVSLRARRPGTARRLTRSTPKASKWPLASEHRMCIPSAWTRGSGVDRQDVRWSAGEGIDLDVEGLGACLADTLPRLPTEDAVIVADAVLAGMRSTFDRGLASMADPWTREELSDLSRLCVSRKAHRKYVWLTAFADGRSASPGESLSRLRIHELGFQKPELQHRVVSRSGELLGVLDFWWPELGLAGEFDGWNKYTDASSYSGQDRDTVFRFEKQRAERIQEEGIRFVRWMWDDLSNPERLAQRLERSGLRRSRPNPC